jgi:hypothetical protein
MEMKEGNYSNVGHRGPVYKGLGAMNPCDLYLYLSFSLAYKRTHTHTHTHTHTKACLVFQCLHSRYQGNQRQSNSAVDFHLRYLACANDVSENDIPA